VFPVIPPGKGNFTNEPNIVDFAGDDFRLRNDSPCFNTGTNQDWMTDSVDLDGKQRLRYNKVDMGACEVIYEGTVYGFR